MIGAWATDGTWLYRRRYGIAPTWGRHETTNELHVIADNEAARWANDAPLRVCGRCEAQTYSDYCPDGCLDAAGNPLELHEGHLTNVVATLRAEGKHEEVEDVFRALEAQCPYRPVAEEDVRWAPDVALAKARDRRERELRAQLGAARG